MKVASWYSSVTGRYEAVTRYPAPYVRGSGNSFAQAEADCRAKAHA